MELLIVIYFEGSSEESNGIGVVGPGRSEQRRTTQEMKRVTPEEDLSTLCLELILRNKPRNPPPTSG